jgi:hypothetical protein
MGKLSVRAHLQAQVFVTMEIKLSLKQAVDAYRVLRRRGSHIVHTSGIQLFG